MAVPVALLTQEKGWWHRAQRCSNRWSLKISKQTWVSGTREGEPHCPPGGGIQTFLALPCILCLEMPQSPGASVTTPRSVRLCVDFTRNHSGQGSNPVTHFQRKPGLRAPRSQAACACVDEGQENSTLSRRGDAADVCGQACLHSHSKFKAQGSADLKSVIDQNMGVACPTSEVPQVMGIVCGSATWS